VVAGKLLEVFRKPFLLSDQSNGKVGASIGVCIYPEGGGDPDALLRNADLAMYRGKATKEHCYFVFDKATEQMVMQQRELTAALGSALMKGELALHYQPQFSLADGSLVGVEALLRWKSGDFGPVSPARFIPVAEESGLILPIGEWVIDTACHELAGLQRRFGPRLVMAVNVSARQIDQAGLLQVVQRAAKANNLDPTSIEIEITESLLMSETPHASDFFEGLRKMGIRVAIDDFGTGFSSMSYLLRYSVDRLKIDRCFIEDCCTNANSAAITSAVIALAHKLNVSVLAEGVESEEQMTFLREAGCDDVQGYYTGRPVTPELLGDGVKV
jgi:EAL domain-containing protein (putative c-di-GMP-specific phosphodiesterase class I)